MWRGRGQGRACWKRTSLSMSANLELGKCWDVGMITSSQQNVFWEKSIDFILFGKPAWLGDVRRFLEDGLGEVDERPLDVHVRLGRSLKERMNVSVITGKKRQIHAPRGMGLRSRGRWSLPSPCWWPACHPCRICCPGSSSQRPRWRVPEMGLEWLSNVTEWHSFYWEHLVRGKSVLLDYHNINGLRSTKLFDK